jgi:hypothetical protein
LYIKISKRITLYDAFEASVLRKERCREYEWEERIRFGVLTKMLTCVVAPWLDAKGMGAEKGVAHPADLVTFSPPLKDRDLSEAYVRFILVQYTYWRKLKYNSEPKLYTKEGLEERLRTECEAEPARSREWAWRNMGSRTSM